MIFDFHKFSKDILHINSQNDFETYLESNFVEIETYFSNISDEELDEIKFDIEDFLYDLFDDKLIQKQNSKIVNAFLILLAEKFLQTSFIGAITIIADYLPQGATKLRLEASNLYLRVNDIANDYMHRCDNILVLLENSAKVDEYNTKAIKSLFYFLQSATNQFQRVDNKLLAKTLFEQLVKYQTNYTFLQDSIVIEFFKSIKNLTLQKIDQKIKNTLNNLNAHKSVCHIENKIIQKENSEYSKLLYSLPKVDFTSIRNISYEYIQSIGDPIELYNNLQRGEKIIDDEKLLYKYLASFGGKHKDKLYGSFELIFEKMQNERFDVVDWGCGQATATILLLNYAQEQNVNLDIENITLIEPSSLALSRALLHIDVLKQKNYNLKAINSDFDCLDEKELETKSTNKTLHLLSNILDIENFMLNNNFFKKISQSYNGDAIFVCVSPFRNDKNNNRLDLFYGHFDENFDTELISARDTDIGNSTRYEKIFEVKVPSVEIVQEKRYELEVIEEKYHLDVIKELEKHSNHVVPILDMKILEDSIIIDPEYAIFKIRKVAEVITSKIYSNYETNASVVSFNDKIRYLSYEKKVFDKSISNYVHTLRTIGNRGVHEHDRGVSKLKLDAHLMIIALISFLNELNDKKLLT